MGWLNAALIDPVREHVALYYSCLIKKIEAKQGVEGCEHSVRSTGVHEGGSSIIGYQFSLLLLFGYDFQCNLLNIVILFCRGCTLKKNKYNLIKGEGS